jgi:hypothetical protein
VKQIVTREVVKMDIKELVRLSLVAFFAAGVVVGYCIAIVVN